MPPVISRFRVTYELLIDRPIQFIPYLLRNRIRPREINKRRGDGGGNWRVSRSMGKITAR